MSEKTARNWNAMLNDFRYKLLESYLMEKGFSRNIPSEVKDSKGHYVIFKKENKVIWLAARSWGFAIWMDRQLVWSNVSSVDLGIDVFEKYLEGENIIGLRDYVEVVTGEEYNSQS